MLPEWRFASAFVPPTGPGDGPDAARRGFVVLLVIRFAHSVPRIADFVPETFVPDGVSDCATPGPKFFCDRPELCARGHLETGFGQGARRDSGLGTRDSGLGVRGRGSGLGTRDSGLGDSGLGVRDSGSGSGLGIRARGSGFGVRGFGTRIRVRNRASRPDARDSRLLTLRAVVASAFRRKTTGETRTENREPRTENREPGTGN